MLEQWHWLSGDDLQLLTSAVPALLPHHDAGPLPTLAALLESGSTVSGRVVF